MIILYDLFADPAPRETSVIIRETISAAGRRGWWAAIPSWRFCYDMPVVRYFDGAAAYKIDVLLSIHRMMIFV